MKVNYKGYTLVLDFSKNGYLVPTTIVELNQSFKDIAQAKRYIDTL